MDGVEVISFYYYPEHNRMFDQDGGLFCDVFRLISPYRYNFLKEVGGTEYVKRPREGIMFELIFPIPGEDEKDY